MLRVVVLSALLATAAAFVPSSPRLALAGPRGLAHAALRPPMGLRLGGQRPSALLRMQEQPAEGDGGVEAKLAASKAKLAAAKAAAQAAEVSLTMELPAEALGNDGAAAKLSAAKAAAKAAELSLTLEVPAEELGDDGAAAKLSAAKAAAQAAEQSLVFGFDEPVAPKPAEPTLSKKDQAQVDRMAKFDADLRKVTSRDTADKATTADLDTRGARMAKGVTEEAKTDLGFDDSKLKVRSLTLSLREDPSW